MASVLISWSRSGGIFLLFGSVPSRCTCCCLLVPLFSFFLPGVFGSVSLTSIKQLLGGYFPLCLSYHLPWWSGGFCLCSRSVCHICPATSPQPMCWLRICVPVWVPSLDSHCLWLCLHFWRFRPALVHTLACKLVSCSPQCVCVVWCWQSSLWTQLQGEEHWSFLSQFLSKSCHFSVEFQPSSISFATVMVLVAFLSTTSFDAGFSFYMLEKNHPALIRKSKSLPLIFRSISRLQPPFLCTKIFFFGNPPHVEFELACLLALFLGVDLPAHL